VKEHAPSTFHLKVRTNQEDRRYAQAGFSVCFYIPGRYNKDAASNANSRSQQVDQRSFDVEFLFWISNKKSAGMMSG